MANDSRVKLKLLRERLRDWNKESFGNIGGRENQLLGEIKNFNTTEESGGLSEVQRQMEDLAKQD